MGLQSKAFNECCALVLAWFSRHGHCFDCLKKRPGEENFGWTRTRKVLVEGWSRRIGAWDNFKILTPIVPFPAF